MSRQAFNDWVSVTEAEVKEKMLAFIKAFCAYQQKSTYRYTKTSHPTEGKLLNKLPTICSKITHSFVAMMNCRSCLISEIR